MIMIITTMITRYQDICRGLPAAPTTSTILNAATTIMAEISTSIQQVINRNRIKIRIEIYRAESVDEVAGTAPTTQGG